MTTPDELERLARRASQEPWEASGSSIQIHRGGTLFVSYRGNGTTDDAAFIAAANPATILALLSERAELLATVERLRGALEFYADEDNWFGVYMVGRGPMGEDWSQDGNPDWPDGKPGKQARAALITGEEK